MKAKKKGGKRGKSINYDTGPAYSATSKSRSIADKKYYSKAGRSGLDSKLYQNTDGSYTRKSIDSSPAEYGKGGKVPNVKQLLKELESGKHKTKGIEPPNMGAMRALKAVARKNTHKA
jgi:hypothetical protein